MRSQDKKPGEGFLPPLRYIIWLLYSPYYGVMIGNGVALTHADKPVILLTAATR